MDNPSIDTRLRRIEIWLVPILLVLTLLPRLWHLEADPPVLLSESTSVYTDHSQYTLYARYFVEQGEFNPYGDYRQPFFLKSSVTAAAVIVFGLLGTGLWQSNLVGVLFAMGALLLFWLFVRRVAGRLAGLVFLGTSGFNYNLLFYGRLPFLEHAMVFWAALALVLLVYSRRLSMMFLAGVCLAGGIFYGKVIGMIFLFPFGCLFLYSIIAEPSADRSMNYRQLGWFVGGFLLLSAVWYVIDFLSVSEQVTGYIGEQAVGLYGWPDGLKSVEEFFLGMSSLGHDSNLFSRMPFVSLAALALVCLVGYHAVRKIAWRKGFQSLNAGHVFVVAMIVAFYGSLMIWNYRPLRYQLPIIYAVYAAGAMVVSLLVSRWTRAKRPTVPWAAHLVWLWPLFVAVMQLLVAVSGWVGGDFNYDDNKLTGLVVAAVLVLIMGWLVPSSSNEAKKNRRRLAIAASVIIVVFSIGQSLYRYLDWRTRITYTVRDNAIDLDGLLGEGAVLSGPYGPTMALVTGREAVIHMFGGAVDANLFRRFPVTHLLLDKGNINLAEEQYPELMKAATHVCTYHVAQEDVRLYRIAGHTDNTQATAYEESILEKAIERYSAGDNETAFELAQEHLVTHPEGITTYLLLVGLVSSTGESDKVLAYLKKAIEFSPTNYNLNAVLGNWYKTRYEETGQETYRQQATEHFRIACRQAPEADKIKRSLEKLEGGRR